MSDRGGAGADEAIEKVRRFDRGEQGLLSVGFTSSATMHPVTPRILEAFSLAYPLVSLGVVLTTLAGIFILGESVSFYKVLGVSLIVAGVLALAIKS